MRLDRPDIGMQKISGTYSVLYVLQPP